jgi:hypothetical protein
MYRVLDEKDLLLMERVKKITGNNYVENNQVEVDKMLDIIQDLICEVGRVQEELEDLQNDVHDNYKRIRNSEMCDINDNMFV